MLKNKPLTYLLLAAVVVVSAGLTLVQFDEDLKSVLLAPPVVALFAAIYRILMDHAAFEREAEIQRRGHEFQLGVASHMANVTFDKHVEFVEEYMEAVNVLMREVFSEHITRKAVELANGLVAIRDRHAAWVTQDMAMGLQPFEDAVRYVGALANFAASTRSVPEYAEQRDRAREAVDRTWSEIFGRLMDPQAALNQTVEIESVKKRIRSLLHIEDIVKVRKAVIERAVQAVST